MEDGVIDQHIMVSSFLQIAVGQTVDTARHFLEATGWKLEEAIQLFYVGDEGENLRTQRMGRSIHGWSSSVVADKTYDNFASLYPPPYAMMFRGPFEKAIGTAMVRNKWLIVNIQSTTEFSSHMLNRDTWTNEAVFETIKANFIFWQVYDDSVEGRNVCSYYKLDYIPIILVIDPITLKNMRSWHGMVEPDKLLEDLLPFLDGSPKDHHVSVYPERPRESSESAIPPADDDSEEDEELQRALAVVSLENNGDISEGDLKKIVDANVEKPAYLPLPEEPKGNRNLICRVVVRLPDGRKFQRNFLHSDPIQLLWSFCLSELKEDGARRIRMSHGIHAIPGSSKTLDYEDHSTFEESGLDNSLISAAWESL